MAERLLHQRIQPAGRLVQHEQVRPGHERGNQDQLLAVALGVGADLLGRIEVEALDQLVPIGGIDAALHPRRAGAASPRRSATATGLPRPPHTPGADGHRRPDADNRTRKSPLDPRSDGSTRAAAGSSSSYPPRSGRGNRPPHRWPPPGRDPEERRPSHTAWTDPRFEPQPFPQSSSWSLHNLLKPREPSRAETFRVPDHRNQGTPRSTAIEVSAGSWSRRDLPRSSYCVRAVRR